MSISIAWRVPKKVVLLTMIGDISSDDLKAYDSQMTEIMNNADGKVHVIGDMTGFNNIKAMPNQVVRNTTYVRHENVGTIVIVGTSGIVEFFLTLVKHIIPVSVERAHTVEDAFSLIRKNDKTVQ